MDVLFFEDETAIVAAIHPPPHQVIRLPLPTGLFEKLHIKATNQAARTAMAAARQASTAALLASSPLSLAGTRLAEAFARSVALHDLVKAAPASHPAAPTAQSLPQSGAQSGSEDPSHATQPETHMDTTAEEPPDPASTPR
eukprot:5840656-Amphidinium_carterae.1